MFTFNSSTVVLFLGAIIDSILWDDEYYFKTEAGAKHRSHDEYVHMVNSFLKRDDDNSDAGSIQKKSSFEEAFGNGTQVSTGHFIYLAPSSWYNDKEDEIEYYYANKEKGINGESILVSDDINLEEHGVDIKEAIPQLILAALVDSLKDEDFTVESIEFDMYNDLTVCTFDTVLYEKRSGYALVAMNDGYIKMVFYICENGWSDENKDKAMALFRTVRADEEIHTMEIAMKPSIPTEQLNTGHFYISVPSKWMLMKSNGANNYYAKKKGSVEAGYLYVKEYDFTSKYRSYERDDYTFIEASISAETKSLEKDVDRITMNGMPAVTLRYYDPKSSKYKNRIIVLNKGYLLNVIYIDENGDSEESWNVAQSFFNTINANDEIVSASTPVATATPRPTPTATPTPKPTPTNPPETVPPQNTEPMVKVQIGGKSVEIRKSFKAQMDALESFFDSYMDFMESPDLFHYAEFMGEYAERMEELEDIDDGDLTDAEYAYYMLVYGRILSRMSLM